MASAVVASATSSPTSTATTTSTSTSTVATTRNNNEDENDYDHDHDQNQDTTTATTTTTQSSSPDSVNNNGVLTTYEDASNNRVDNSDVGIMDVDDVNDTDINSSNNRHHRQLLLEEEEERSLLKQKSHSIKNVKAEETILSSSSSPLSLFETKIDSSDIPEGTVSSHPTSATNNKSFGEGPLPRELRRIIQEVAKTGACSWLSWSQETTTPASCRRGGEVTARTSTTANNIIINNNNNRISPSHGYAAAAAGSTTSSLTKAGIAAAAAAAAAAGSSSSSQYSLSLTMKNVNGHTNSNSSNYKRQSSFSGTGGGGGGGTSRRSTSAFPSRKKHRNGLIHKKGGERMRFGNPDGAFGRNSNSSSTSSSSRKRPLGHVRTTTTNSTSTSSGGNNNNNINNSSNCSNSNNTNNNNNNNTYNNTVNGTLFSGGATTLGGLYSSAPSSVGSGRSTGSEPDYDSTQYECDSEGTSATTNSEISVRKTTRAKRSGASNTPGETQINNGPEDDALTATMGDYGDDDDDDEMNSIDDNNTIPGSPYKNLQTAFRVALGLVLDHFYHNRNNGYKLSPAEKRRNDRLAETVNNNANSNNDNNNNNNGTNKGSTMTNGDKLSSLLSSEHVFQQRRQRLMATLLPAATSHMEDGQQRRQRLEKISDDPPFTIQRIAEVLVAPDRYYTQTHKLCNCLEKLLLVISSTNAFGGSTGGDSLSRRREERELAALADEKGRQESKLRQRRLRKRNSSPIDELVAEETSDSSSSVSTEHGMKEDTIIRDSENKSRSFPVKSDNEDEAMIANESSTSPEQKQRVGGSSKSTSREMLEALARASLRTKFDHVGVEPLPSNMNEREIQTMVENRSMTNSPPPHNLNMTASGPNIALPNHAGGGVNGYVRQHQHLSEQQQNSDHNAVARATSPILFSSGNDANLETATNLHMLQLHHAVALSGRSNSSPLELMTIDASTISQIRSQSNAAGAGGSESTDGRSSASNSDVDSESDDMFDDSASDRSDGSDSGSTTHHEPFTAARAMALNRMQQQQRLQQSRVLTSLGSSHHSEGFRPPVDSEYQSGDSIDSMRCEDSGGSDSSVSSDFAD